MKKRLIKLIDVKSIITLFMTLVFCIMSVVGTISSQQFMTVFATVIAFYFGTQQKKNTTDNSNNQEDRYEL